MSTLVTGEAVALDLQLAKLPSRGLAHAVDAVVQVAILLALTIALSIAGAGLDEAMTAAIVLVTYVAVTVGYPVLCETLTRGRTLGKMALGLRVVREDGGPITFRHALVRGLARVFIDLPLLGTLGFIGIFVSLASPKGKRVGDYLAGTVVIRTRVPRHATPVIMMPPQLAGWAAQLDLSGLPDTVALSARQFLARYGELNPGVRDTIGDDLTNEVARHVQAPPPPGVPSWAYLSAVLAERRGREQARTAEAAPAHESAPAPTASDPFPPSRGPDFRPPR